MACQLLHYGSDLGCLKSEDNTSGTEQIEELWRKTSLVSQTAGKNTCVVTGRPREEWLMYPQKNLKNNHEILHMADV